MTEQRPTFETRDRERIYEFVDEHGEATFEELVDANLLTDPDRYQQLIAVMKRDGLLEEDGGTLRPAMDAGIEETHHLDGTEVTIRPARQEDISGIIGVMKQIAGEKRYIVAEDVARELAADSALMRGDLEDRRFFVATIDDEVVGGCGVERPQLEKLAHTAELTLGILEEYRGEDIGSHLLQRAMSWAKKEDFHKVYNSVPSTNIPGIEFLEDHGWDTEAIRRNHYRIDGEFVDEVMMAYRMN
ncbi:GNAT family N-acetyltransferase [Natronomonas halophila]|uniref:GNAT family N-acetyltransferase n=1 Tax=Natronomonas halophila TaxID=2747817 RepID=UPI0015B419DE|nr:GNAT family N-acetyltransferase [Natronomonas halophila]QLD85179.1 GNAT family N-acetyltransferase [Natronomonas halophila]